LYRTAQTDVQKLETQLTALQAVADAAQEILAQHYRVSTAPQSYVITNVDARDNAVTALAAALEKLKGSA
jgi:hypothetical protein